MHRFFIPIEQIPVITGSDARQIQTVLRMKPGDKLELADGSGKIYGCKIKETEKDRVVCQILETKEPTNNSKIKITIAQCLPKAKKMDLIIQKCTELGVAEIIPVISERTVAKGEKPERWQKLAKEAAEQSGGSFIPTIKSLISFGEILNLAKDYDLALIPWELETDNYIKKALSNNLKNILVLIGSEGGFSQKEVEQAKTAGFTSVSLGKRILRTETAGITILSMINYEYEQ